MIGRVRRKKERHHGSPLETATWNDAAGPIYMGANSSWELIWLAVAVALCVIAIASGNRHENDAYKKLANKKNGNG